MSAHVSHRYCAHENTAVARAVCRKARASMTDPAKLVRSDEGFVSADGQFAVFPLEERDSDGNRYEVVRGATVVDYVPSVKVARERVRAAY